MICSLCQCPFVAPPAKRKPFTKCPCCRSRSILPKKFVIAPVCWLEKACRSCGLVKSIREFWRKPETRDGHDSRCCVCHGAAKTPEQKRRHSRTFFRTHPEFCRKSRGNRNQQIADTDDGTLTPDFLRVLFTAAIDCPYCGKRMCDDKSLDHVIALSVGGAHSASNVIVCCLRCNIKKGNRPLVMGPLKPPER